MSEKKINTTVTEKRSETSYVIELSEDDAARLSALIYYTLGSNEQFTQAFRDIHKIPRKNFKAKINSEGMSVGIYKEVSIF